MRKGTKRPPEKEARRFAYCRRSLNQILVRRQPGQRLNVAQIDHRVRWNECMAARNDAIEPIDADEESRRKRKRDIAFRDLRISQIRRDAEPSRKQRRIDRRRCECWNAVEAARIRERLDHAAVRAAESGHIAHKTESKLIVKDSVVTSDDCLRRCGPGEADTRRKVLLCNEL